MSEILPPADVLEIIDPVDPDQLFHVGQGVYRASWIDNEQMEVYLLQHTPRVQVLDVFPFNSGVAVTFTVEPGGYR
jgi:hypothetical protein